MNFISKVCGSMLLALSRLFMSKLSTFVDKYSKNLFVVREGCGIRYSVRLSPDYSLLRSWVLWRLLYDKDHD